MSLALLARLQFALTISFHYIFPTLSIGLGTLLAVMEGLYLRTGNAVYHQMAKFWTGIFALIFALGVATGLVMEFEFGTNWATYSRYVGDIFGSALAAEGIFAFFLESGFLAILVFGWDKVRPRTHFIATLLVALGAIFSAVWIIIANSWQQTPAGFEIVGHGLAARAHVTDFWAMVWNHSSVVRIAHAVLGGWMSGAFLVSSVSAFYLLKNKHIDFAKAGLKIGLISGLIFSCMQLVSGHLSAFTVAQYQPVKLAAMEGVYSSTTPPELHLVGWVDDKHHHTLGIGIPGGLSFLLHANFTTPIQGLDQVPQDLKPPVNIVFQTYHLMVAIGMALIGVSVLGVFLLWRKQLFTCRPFLWLLVFSVLLPQMANEVGWWTAEVGRQPWVVYGLLKTPEGLSKAVTANQVGISIILFMMIYTLLFVLFVFLLNNKIKNGPQQDSKESDNTQPQSPRLARQGELFGETPL